MGRIENPRVHGAHFARFELNLDASFAHSVVSEVMKRCRFLMLLSAMMVLLPDRAAAVLTTFDLVNFPAVQEGHQVSGTITIDLSGPLTSTPVLINHSQIVDWDIHATYTTGPNSYDAHFTEADPLITDSTTFLHVSTAGLHLGGNLHFRTTNTSTLPSLVTHADLRYDNNSGNANYRLSEYFGSNEAPIWQSLATDADFPFPSTGDPWIIATPVPEPGSSVLLGVFALMAAAVRVRRR